MRRQESDIYIGRHLPVNRSLEVSIRIQLKPQRKPVFIHHQLCDFDVMLLVIVVKDTDYGMVLDVVKPL